MKKEKSRKKKTNQTIGILKVVFSVILGIVTGPLELLCAGLIIKGKDLQLLWLIGAIFVFSILYLLVLFFLNNFLHRKDDDGDKCWLIMRILAPISIFATWFLIAKYNGDGNITSIIFAMLFMLPNVLFFVPAGSDSGSSNKKIRATTWNFGKYSETTYRDEKGNKIAESTSFDWGPVRDTKIKDRDGNETNIEHWKF